MHSAETLSKKSELCEQQSDKWKRRIKISSRIKRSIYFTVKISWCKHWCIQMKRTDLDYDATPPCCTECLAVILLQTTEMASELWIWEKNKKQKRKNHQKTQTIQKELTASGIITCIRWKPRRLCMLKQNWQGETGNHRLGKLRFSCLGRCCIQMPSYGLKLLSICGEKALEFYSPWS